MGERKGTNKYYPPDYDPTKGGLNKFLGTHALRERARKLHLGILIIRFEMPYNIWCEGCKNHIGMGVRYNAEKTKVGMYYTTPVYQFRMKCHLCPNYIEMRTDPGNLDYIIISGASRQERRWDPTENGQVVPDDKAVIRQLSSDAMFKLEHGVQDKSKLKGVSPTIAKLEDLQERWKDDYSANKIMRSLFRNKKKELKVIEDKDNEFLKKNSLDIALLPESSEDSHIASLLKLEPTMTSEERQQQKRLEIERKTKFPNPLSENGDIKSQIETFQEKSEKQRASLGISIVPKNRISNNTKSATATSSSSSAMDMKDSNSGSQNIVKDPSSVVALTESDSIIMKERCNNEAKTENRDSDSDNNRDHESSCPPTKIRKLTDGEQVSCVSKKNSDTNDSNSKNANIKLSLSLLCDYGSSSDESVT